MVEVTYQMVLSTLQTTGLLVDIVYYIMTLNNSRKNQQHALETRQAQLYMQLYSFYDNKEFIKDYGNVTNTYAYDNIEEWWDNYSPKGDIEVYSSWLRVGRFFDGVGILLERNLIDKDLIYELLGDLIRGSWEGGTEDTGMGRWVQEARVFWERPILWKNFETLYKDYMKWIKQKEELTV